MSKYQMIDMDYNIDQCWIEMALPSLGLFCFFFYQMSAKYKWTQSNPIITQKAQNSVK